MQLNTQKNEKETKNPQAHQMKGSLQQKKKNFKFPLFANLTFILTQPTFPLEREAVISGK